MLIANSFVSSGMRTRSSVRIHDCVSRSSVKIATPRPTRQHELRLRTVHRIAGGDLPRARLQERLLVGRHDPSAHPQDREDRADRHVDVDVRRAVERVEQQQVLAARIVLGDREDGRHLLGRHRGEVAAPFVGLEQDLVGDHVELLLGLALDVAGAGLAEHAAERALADLERDLLAGAGDDFDQQAQRGLQRGRRRRSCVIALLFDQVAGQRDAAARADGSAMRVSEGRKRDARACDRARVRRTAPCRRSPARRSTGPSRARTDSSACCADACSAGPNLRQRSSARARRPATDGLIASSEQDLVGPERMAASVGAMERGCVAVEEAAEQRAHLVRIGRRIRRMPRQRRDAVEHAIVGLEGGGLDAQPLVDDQRVACGSVDRSRPTRALLALGDSRVVLRRVDDRDERARAGPSCCPAVDHCRSSRSCASRSSSRAR